MTRLTITRRQTDRGQCLYAAFDATEPQDADMLARLLKNRAYDTATVEVDFSPAGSPQLNVPARELVEVERDRLAGLLAEARRCLSHWADEDPARSLIARIDAALPQTAATEPPLSAA